MKHISQLTKLYSYGMSRTESLKFIFGKFLIYNALLLALILCFWFLSKKKIWKPVSMSSLPTSYENFEHSFPLKKDLFILCVQVFLWMYLCAPCACSTQRGQKGALYQSGARVTNGCELPCRTESRSSAKKALAFNYWSISPGLEFGNFLSFI